MGGGRATLLDAPCGAARGGARTLLTDRLCCRQRRLAPRAAGSSSATSGHSQRCSVWLCASPLFSYQLREQVVGAVYAPISRHARVGSAAVPRLHRHGRLLLALDIAPGAMGDGVQCVQPDALCGVDACPRHGFPRSRLCACTVIAHAPCWLLGPVLRASRAVALFAGVHALPSDGSNRRRTPQPTHRASPRSPKRWCV